MGARTAQRLRFQYAGSVKQIPNPKILFPDQDNMVKAGDVRTLGNQHPHQDILITHVFFLLHLEFDASFLIQR